MGTRLCHVGFYKFSMYFVPLLTYIIQKSTDQNMVTLGFMDIATAAFESLVSQASAMAQKLARDSFTCQHRTL